MDGNCGSCNDGPTKDMRWINNGEINKYISKNDQVLNGWEYGKCDDGPLKDKKVITDGITNKYIPKNDQVLNGWELRKLL
jgi:hypothetical protein